MNKASLAFWQERIFSINCFLVTIYIASKHSYFLDFQQTVWIENSHLLTANFDCESQGLVWEAELFSLWYKGCIYAGNCTLVAESLTEFYRNYKPAMALML